MKLTFLLLLFFFPYVGPAGAQAPHEAAIGPVVKAGMSLAYVDLGRASLSDPAQRVWQCDATLGLSPRFGMGIDLGYSHPDIPGPHNAVLSYLAGPVLYPSTNSNVQTYIHGFAGLARVGESRVLSTGESGDRHTKLVWKFGAGVEIFAFGPIHMRLGLDYIHSQDYNSGYQIRGQNHLRQMIGLQYVFGSPRKRQHRIK